MLLPAFLTRQTDREGERETVADYQKKSKNHRAGQLYKTVKTHAGKTQRDSVQQQSDSGKVVSWALPQGKPSVAYVRSSGENSAFCLKLDTDVVNLTFDLLTQNIRLSRTHGGTILCQVC